MAEARIPPAMARQIELWPVERLVPYARNARTHSDEQIAQIAASIVEFGFKNPILVDTNAGIIAGHGRLLAARKLGLEEVPVVVLDHLSETQKRAYILADNRLGANAGWDEEMLRGGTRGPARPTDSTSIWWASPTRNWPSCWPMTEPEAEPPADGGRRDSRSAGRAGHAARRRLVDRKAPADLRRLPRSRHVVAELFDGREANVVITSPPYATQREYDPASGFKPVPPEEYVRVVPRRGRRRRGGAGAGRLLLPEHQGARRRRRAESVRDGSGAGAPAAVGLAVRRRILLAQDRQRRAGRLGKPIQERMGAGVPFLPPAADQVPAQGGRPRVGGLLRLLARTIRNRRPAAGCWARGRAAQRPMAGRTRARGNGAGAACPTIRRAARGRRAAEQRDRGEVRSPARDRTPLRSRARWSSSS